jgi:hypothetical protein
MKALTLAGETVRSEHVQQLASMLDGHPLGTKLQRALDNGNTLVALSTDDRDQLLEVLPTCPPGLRGLYDTLRSQREKSKARELQKQRHAQMHRDRARQPHSR